MKYNTKNTTLPPFDILENIYPCKIIFLPDCHFVAGLGLKGDGTVLSVAGLRAISAQYGHIRSSHT